jgi:hypothetical protein
VGPAAFDFIASPTASVVSTNSRSIAGRTSPGTAASSASLLLSMAQSDFEVRSFDDLLTESQVSSEQSLGAIDHLFASLEEGDFFANAGLSSSLL